jgi:hypothetical protein
MKSSCQFGLHQIDYFEKLAPESETRAAILWFDNTFGL